MTESKYSKFRCVMSAIISAVFTIVGIAAVAAAVFFCVKFKDHVPILLSTPEEAKSNIIAMMDAVCEGDYTQAEQYMLGAADFGVDRQPKDTLGAIIWEKYLDSMDYELVGDCYTTEAGLAQSITFSCLDVNSVLANLRERSEAKLTEYVENAESVSDIYDENNEYRTEIIEQALTDAVKDAIREDSQMMTVELVLNLKYENGKWWIVPDSVLVDAIFGDILF